MKTWPTVRAVAGFEFRRFFKWKDQLWALLLSAIGGAIGFGSAHLVNREKPRDVRIAVIGGDALPFAAPPGSRLKIEPASRAEEAALRDAVGRGDRDGLLILLDADRAQLLVNKEPPWKAELGGVLDAARRQARIAALQLAPQQLADVFSPVALELQYHEEGRQPVSKTEKIFAVVLIGLMLYGVFIGSALFLVGITSEKQNRVTEQIVAAIGPQTWIDGKLLGLTLSALSGLLVMAVSSALFVLAWDFFADWRIQTPMLVFNLPRLALFTLFSMLGIAFWNCFIGAVSATINDPNTSSRNAFLFLPMVPVALAFLALPNPDSTTLRVFSILPGFSSALIPARMALSTVPAWEVGLALLALLAGIWGMRRLAGRVFATAILMYGREPTFKEVWRWLRTA